MPRILTADLDDGRWRGEAAQARAPFVTNLLEAYHVRNDARPFEAQAAARHLFDAVTRLAG